jgi:hypothetical protein
MSNLELFLTNEFLGKLSDFYMEKSKNQNKNQIFLSIIKEIIYTLLNIYTLIYEQILENINVIPNCINISKEIIQCSFDNLINLLNYNLVKNLYDENITNILALIFSINNEYIYLDISKGDIFYNTFYSLFNKYKYI